MSVANHILCGKRWSYQYFELYDIGEDLELEPHENDFWVGFRLYTSF